MNQNEAQELSRYFSRMTPPELQKIVSDFVPEDGHMVIQAGHFLLVSSADRPEAVPGVCQVMQEAGFPNDLCREAGLFPIATLRLGLRLIQTIPACSRALLLLVNDWQFLKGAPEKRERFYANNRQLISAYQEEFCRFGVAESVILPPPSRDRTGVYFSEVDLRNRFKKSARNVRCEMSEAERKEVENQTGLFCGRPNCTGEVAELMKAVAGTAEGPVYFINIYPQSCQAHVNLGTGIAYRIFGLEELHVLNIGLPNMGLSSEEDILRHVHIDILSRDLVEG